MRILIISDAWTPQTNGVVRTYEHINRHLEKDGHTVRVIGPADFRWRMPMPGYAEIDLALFPGQALCRMVDSFAPDTIHIATEGPLGWAMRRLCRRRGWAFTTAFHTYFPDYTALRVAKYIPLLYRPVRAFCVGLVRHFHAPAAAVMTTTAGVEADLRRWGFTVPLCRLTRGADLAVFHPGPGGALPDTIKRPVALYVGRVAIEKNIEAFLSMKWPGSKVVVGDGPALPALKAAWPGALFAGKQTGAALAAYFRSADVFVFPSRTDTFGIVLVEAMACGLPIAAYPVTGPADIVTDDTLGALDDDLEKAAQRALTSPGTASQRFTHVEATYTWALAARQFMDAQQRAVLSKS